MNKNDARRTAREIGAQIYKTFGHRTRDFVLIREMAPSYDGYKAAVKSIGRIGVISEARHGYLKASVENANNC